MIGSKDKQLNLKILRKKAQKLYNFSFYSYNKLVLQPDSDDEEEVDQADSEDRLHEEIAALYSLKVATNSK